MERVRLAVVGYGLIGKEHVRRVLGEAEARLVAIVEPAPAAAARAAAHGAPVLASLEELLERRLADGVVLATPSTLHVPQAIACLEAGLPVLVEKPVADTVEAGRRLVAVAEASGVPVLVGHHRRHSAWIGAAKALLADGAIGRVTTCDALTWHGKPDSYFAPEWRRRPGAGPVLTNLVHVIDDLRNLLGEIVEVRGLASSAVRGHAVEDSAAALLRFASGALGTVSVSDCAAAPWSWEHAAGESGWFPTAGEACYRIAGTRGALALPGLDLWRHAGDAGWMAPFVHERRPVPVVDPLAVELRHFCAVVRGSERPLLDARGGLATLAATLAVLEAARLGTAVTPLGPEQVFASS